MQGLTRRPHTEKKKTPTFTIEVSGSPAKVREVRKLVRENVRGVKIREVSSGEDQERIPWRKTLPTENEAATVLRGLRHREGLTQIQLAKKAHIPQRHLSEMENGKRPIGREMAQRLAEALEANYRTLL